MAVESLAYCGLRCDQCTFREKTNCPGCHAAGGKLFWGRCALAVCCIGKGLAHCGQCAEFPCQQLRDFSFAKEHGDNGQRIENLRAARAAELSGGGGSAGTQPIVVEPMTEDFIVWRCLHGGPLSRESIEAVTPHPAMDWPATRARNLPLMTKLVRTYGSCAILAREGSQVVGMLRFYPKAVYEMPEAGKMCMQQAHPAGANLELVNRDFPPLEQIQDKTLLAYCLFVTKGYQRKGLATRLAKELIAWGRRHGWQAVEAIAYEDVPALYSVTGVAGKTFWKKLGFEIVRRDAEPQLLKLGSWMDVVRREGAELGLSANDVANQYKMRLAL